MSSLNAVSFPRMRIVVNHVFSSPEFTASINAVSRKGVGLSLSTVTPFLSSTGRCKVRLYESGYLPSAFRTSQPRLYVLIMLKKYKGKCVHRYIQG